MELHGDSESQLAPETRLFPSILSRTTPVFPKEVWFSLDVVGNLVVRRAMLINGSLFGMMLHRHEHGFDGEVDLCRRFLHWFFRAVMRRWLGLLIWDVGRFSILASEDWEV